MFTIMDFPEHIPVIKGYFRIRTGRISDINIDLLLKKFKAQSFYVPSFPPGDVDLWLCYQAHIFLMDELKNSPNIFYKLYIELIYTYHIFCKRADFEHYKEYYPEQLFFNSELLTSSMRTLICETGYPHRTLCYCMRNLLREWTPLRIAVEMGSFELDKMLNELKLEYGKECGAHKFFIDYMFSPLKKNLNHTLNFFIENFGNDDEKFLKITQHILNQPTGTTRLDDYFGKHKPSEKAQMISLWCIRVKKAIINKTISILKNQNYYIENVTGEQVI